MLLRFKRIGCPLVDHWLTIGCDLGRGGGDSEDSRSLESG